MPRATDNRKPVGTEHCDECGTTARFYQVQRGNRLGYLYRRCECGADQKTGAAIQVKWLSRMQRTPEPMIPHPLETEKKPADPLRDPVKNDVEPREQETPEPQAPQGLNRKKESNKAGLIGFAAMVGAVALAVLT